jgi:hypothetical protein
VCAGRAFAYARSASVAVAASVFAPPFSIHVLSVSTSAAGGRASGSVATTSRSVPAAGAIPGREEAAAEGLGGAGDASGVATGGAATGTALALVETGAGGAPFSSRLQPKASGKNEATTRKRTRSAR